MRETAFIKHNADRWEQSENLLHGENSATPDEISDSYILLTEDLSYTRTFFSRGKSRKYLNQLAGDFHNYIYQNKGQHIKRISGFWKYEVPEAVYQGRKQIMYAIILFLISIFIGVISSANDDRYTRLILGDGYIDMTLENIEKGDPMGVYRSMKSSNMFFAISSNNIRVSFLAFVLGIFASFGTAYIVISNGIMVGAFQYFFVAQGLFWESFLAIFIHGALELSAIAIAGGAGFVLGNSILFPGSLPRNVAVLKSAKVSLKIVIGLVPVFIVAGFLESFVTRAYNVMPTSLRIAIILASFSFIIFYFFIYPIRLHKQKTNTI